VVVLSRRSAPSTGAGEELRIGKPEVQRGEVLVNKSVRTEHVSTPSDLSRIER
jgi:hypothetical protein